MRLRHKPWANDMLADYPNYVIHDADHPENLRGKWTERFGNDQPIHIEIGMGKGQFIIESAKRHPEINYIGIERQSSVMVSALEKQIEEDLDNVWLLRENGRVLTDYFAPGEVDRIYLTFSDPWPKNRHEKRRLTYKDFLAVYEQLLHESGELHFKTDNQGLFEYSLASFSQYGMILDEVYLDLHASDFEDNVMTEYEEKFSEKGQRIYRVHAHFPPINH